MSGELSEWEETIATYRHCHHQLVRLAVVLLERGEDLTGLKETIYDLDENQAKDILTVSVAEMAYYWRELPRRRRRNRGDHRLRFVSLDS